MLASIGALGLLREQQEGNLLIPKLVPHVFLYARLFDHRLVVQPFDVCHFCVWLSGLLRSNIARATVRAACCAATLHARHVCVWLLAHCEDSAFGDAVSAEETLMSFIDM